MASTARTAKARKSSRDSCGSVRRLPSGRVQARYAGPDERRYAAPTTFDTVDDARAWLTLRNAEMIKDEWLPETTRKVKKPVLFRSYADSWLAGRPLKPGGQHDWCCRLPDLRRVRDGHLQVGSGR